MARAAVGRNLIRLASLPEWNSRLVAGDRNISITSHAAELLAPVSMSCLYSLPFRGFRW